MNECWDVIPKESFVARSIDVGQFDTDSFGMTEFLTGLGQPDITISPTRSITVSPCLFKCSIPCFFGGEEEVFY